MKIKKFLKIITPIAIFLILTSDAFAQTTKLIDNSSDLGSSQQEQEGAFEAATGLTSVSVSSIIGIVIQVILSFLGIIFLSLMIYAGFMWMTAQGDESKVEKARRIIITAVVGLLIVIAAYSITSFVFNSLDSAF